MSKSIKENNPYKPIIFSCAEDVIKGWGRETHICNHIFPNAIEGGFCGKFLKYEKVGAICSMHSHFKFEVFYILSGRFEFNFIDITNADKKQRILAPGDVVTIPPMNPHQVRCLELGTIIEFSTPDYEWDNYRVEKGSSQNKI